MTADERRRLYADIERWRDAVFDSDAAVDDARAVLCSAERERDRAVAHLQHLIGWALDTLPGGGSPC